MDIIKSINGEELTVRLSGRLDANTVSELDQSLTGLESVRSLVLDFEQLEYLSSAGLRQILKYKKRIDATCVVNCGKEVYDIMEMTGFTEIMSVSRQLRRISVDDCELIGEGHSEGIQDTGRSRDDQKGDRPLEEGIYHGNTHRHSV